MRLIIIDPQRQTVDNFYGDCDFQALRKLTGVPIQRGLYAAVIAEYIDTLDICWSDDAVKLNGELVYGYFLGFRRRNPFIGRSVVVGLNKKHRNRCDTTSNIDTMRSQIRWLGAGNAYVRQRGLLFDIMWSPL